MINFMEKNIKKLEEEKQIYINDDICDHDICDDDICDHDICDDDICDHDICDENIHNTESINHNFKLLNEYKCLLKETRIGLNKLKHYLSDHNIKKIHEYDNLINNSKKKIEKLKDELKLYKNDRNNDIFYTMIMNYYSNSNQVKKTIKVNAEYITKNKYGSINGVGYKCPYCNNIHRYEKLSYEKYTYGEICKLSKCCMIFPNDLQQVNVKINIDIKTKVID
jgi:hypothetical protein